VICRGRGAEQADVHGDGPAPSRSLLFPRRSSSRAVATALTCVSPPGLDPGRAMIISVPAAIRSAVCARRARPGLPHGSRSAPARRRPARPSSRVALRPRPPAPGPASATRCADSAQECLLRTPVLRTPASARSRPRPSALARTRRRWPVRFRLWSRALRSSELWSRARAPSRRPLGLPGPWPTRTGQPSSRALTERS
jgi:hypothetical protein